MENSDKMEEQLRELESNGELPPIALQASGHMFRQHAELMFSHARELESVFGELETATTTATTTANENIIIRTTATQITRCSSNNYSIIAISGTVVISTAYSTTGATARIGRSADGG